MIISPTHACACVEPRLYFAPARGSGFNFRHYWMGERTRIRTRTRAHEHTGPSPNRAYSADDEGLQRSNTRWLRVRVASMQALYGGSPSRIALYCR